MPTPYLFETHDRETLRRWATSLRVFRFLRAAGGHANDGDAFLAALAYDGEADLRTLLDALGLPAVEVPPDAPRPVPGRTYTATEFIRFPSPVPDAPRLRQPSHSTLGGEACHVWAGAGRLGVSVHGVPPADPYAVAETDFLRARRIEAHLDGLDGLDARILDPPNPRCITPATMPGFWTDVNTP